MATLAIVAQRIIPLSNSCNRPIFASSLVVCRARRRQRQRSRNDLLPDQPKQASSSSHQQQQWLSSSLSPPRTRRWMSGSSSRKGNGSTPTDDESERRQDHRHCVEMVRTRDYEGYLCGLLMPSSAQEGYFAIRAYNVEIATIKDAASSTSSFSRRHGSFHTNMEDNNTMGDVDPAFASRLRMQWWADAITEIFDEYTMEVEGNNDNVAQNGGLEPRHPNPLTTSTLSSSSSSLSSLHGHSALGLHKNPTLRSLRRAVHEHQLTHRFLRRMTEAREFDLDVVQYDRLRDVAQYGEDTLSNMLYSTLECVGVRDEATDEVASDIGVSLGILTALRSTAFRASRGECSIPRELTIKHSVTMDTLWSGLNASLNPTNSTALTTPSPQDILCNATAEMVDRATFHMQRARSKQSVVPKEARMCLLPAVCGIHYLNSLKECNYDVLHPSLVGGGVGADVEDGDVFRLARRRRLGLMFLLGRTWLTGTF